LFTAERREQRHKQEMEILKELVKLVK